MAPTKLTADRLLQQAIPDLLTSGNTTQSDSTHRLTYASTLGEWKRFEMDARRYFESLSFKNTVLDYAMDAQDDNPFHLNREQLYCGDEHSVVARFGQHLGHSMTAIFRSTCNYNVRFGDFKAVRLPLPLPKKVPDTALMTDEGVPLMIGEAKTPWVHDLSEITTGRIRRYRQSLGQIANYLRIFNVKYGFLTTYEQTIFVKQEPHPSTEGKWVLWVSPVVHHATPSARVRDTTNYTSYHSHVSLRECFLYMMSLVVQDPTAKNEMSGDAWASFSTRWKDDDFLSDGSGYSEENYQPRPTRRSRTASSRPPPERRDADVDNLTRRMQRTRIEHDVDQVSGHSQFVDVYYSRSRKCWFYNVDDDRVYIDLLCGTHRDGSAYEWFVANGTRYLATRRS